MMQIVFEQIVGTRSLFNLTLYLWFIGVKNIFPNKGTPKTHVISTLAVIKMNGSMIYLDNLEVINI